MERSSQAERDPRLYQFLSIVWTANARHRERIDRAVAVLHTSRRRAHRPRCCGITPAPASSDRAGDGVLHGLLPRQPATRTDPPQPGGRLGCRRTSYGFFVLAASVYKRQTRSITRFFSFSIAATLIVLLLKYDRPAADTNNRYAQVSARSFQAINLFPATRHTRTVVGRPNRVRERARNMYLNMTSATAPPSSIFRIPLMLYAFTGSGAGIISARSRIPRTTAFTGAVPG